MGRAEKYSDKKYGKHGIRGKCTPNKSCDDGKACNVLTNRCGNYDEKGLKAAAKRAKISELVYDAKYDLVFPPDWLGGAASVKSLPKKKERKSIKKEFSVGDIVNYTRPNGEKGVGTIVMINLAKKAAKIEKDDGKQFGLLFNRIEKIPSALEFEVELSQGSSKGKGRKSPSSRGRKSRSSSKGKGRKSPSSRGRKSRSSSKGKGRKSPSPKGVTFPWCWDENCGKGKVCSQDTGDCIDDQYYPDKWKMTKGAHKLVGGYDELNKLRLMLGGEVDLKKMKKPLPMIPKKGKKPLPMIPKKGKGKKPLPRPPKGKKPPRPMAISAVMKIPAQSKKRVYKEEELALSEIKREIEACLANIEP